MIVSLMQGSAAAALAYSLAVWHRALDRYVENMRLTIKKYNYVNGDSI